ncbi:MAG: hypothetical protein JWQ47_320 [Glaciihabitans sp.]|nr:hypothetical protein [Glaciihabitans sp.]
MSTDSGMRDDHGIVTLLRSEGMAEEARLAESLAELQTLALSEAPAPSPSLESLMAAPARRARRARPALVILISAGATLGLGVSAAAAVSPEFRTSTGRVIQTLAEIVAPGSIKAPTDSPSPVPKQPGQTPIPNSPAVPAPATTHPTHPAVPATPGGVGAGKPTSAPSHKPADPGRPTDPGRTDGGGSSGTRSVHP